MVTQKKKPNPFEKRNFKTSALSNVMPSIMKTLGKSGEAKKHAGLMRIINHWADIVGQDMADHTSPVKIISRRQQCRKTGNVGYISLLKIKCSGAMGTAIAMRGQLIAQRLNRLFATDKFTDVIIENGTIETIKAKKHQRPRPQKHYDLNLPEVNDPVLKMRLESLGQAVMNSARKS
jgi:hypothetical protein